MKKKRVTIVDIAKEAEVSKATVSRYLNGHYEYMSVETKNRLEKIIKLRNYNPSNVAVSLAKNRTRLIGIVVADIENPFSAATIKSISDNVMKTKYNMIIADSNNDIEQEKKNIMSFVEQRVDAILVNTTSYDTTYLKEVSLDIPVILMDRLTINDEMDVVHADNITPINEVIDHLVEKGYTDIHWFTEDYSYISTRRDRRQSFIKKMLQLGYSNPEVNTHTIDKNSSKEIKETVINIVKNSNGVPAIICCNGPVLMQTAITIRHLAINIPQDLGLCGYDDFGSFTKIGWSELAYVPLTTLNPDWNQLGKKAIEIAFERIKNPNAPVKTVSVSVTLLKRGSTQRIGVL